MGITSVKVSTKVNDANADFDLLPQTGKYEKFSHLPYFGNIGFNHVQGYTYYQVGNSYYYIFSHNTSGDYGYILITNSLSGKVKEIKTPKGWNHPGGIQCVGTYLFVPCGTDDKSLVLVYDIAKINFDSNEDDIAPLKQIEFSINAAAIGITDFIYNGKDSYLLVLASGTTYTAYVSEIPADDNMGSLSFSRMGSFDLSEVKNTNLDCDIVCQGFGLITDKSNNVYMIALYAKYHTTYADWGYLIKLNIGTNSISFNAADVKSRHFNNKGGVSGVDGSHFRWGAGINVKPDEKLILLATSRNIIAGTKLDTTFWL